MALTEPALWSACLAYASQVLFLNHRVSLEVKDELHNRALRQLTSLLTLSHKSDSIGAILATTVLLRMTEQFLELDEDHQYHLYGSSTLFENEFHDWSVFDDNTPSISFWAYVRGTIRISFLLEKPSPFDLDRLNIMNSLSQGTKMPDHAYTNAMTYLLAELCTVCWSDSQLVSHEQNAIQKLDELEYAIRLWKDGLPGSFNPWYVDFGDNDTFPDIRYLAPWHC